MRIGITPAYAGNTGHPREVMTYPWDHPRVCGEHSSGSMPFSMPLGSPPRMRGTPVFLTIAKKRTGITPAYAGNTFRPRRDSNRPRDHPRVCGEHGIFRPLSRRTTGSPPRMRGTHAKQEILLRALGITPAYAGNTFHTPDRSHRQRDHPRVCGEHIRQRIR